MTRPRREKIGFFSKIYRANSGLPIPFKGNEREQDSRRSVKRNREYLLSQLDLNAHFPCGLIPNRSGYRNTAFVKAGATVNVEDSPLLWLNHYLDTYKGDTFVVEQDGGGCVFAGDEGSYAGVEEINYPQEGLTTNFNSTLLGKFPNVVALNLESNLISNIDFNGLENLKFIRISVNRLTAAKISNILQTLNINGATNGYFQANFFNRRNLISNNENLANFTAENIANRIYDSSLDLWKVIENTASAVHRISRSLSVTFGLSYTISIYVKAAERTVFYFQDGGAGQPNQRILFDLINLNIVYSGLTSFTNGIIESLENGIYKVSARYTPASTSTINMLFGFAITTSNPIYLGNGTSGIFIGKPQFEFGASATEYDPNPLSREGQAAQNSLNSKGWTTVITS